LIPGQPVQKSARPHLNKQAEIYGLCLWSQLLPGQKHETLSEK
jgi:hypothetical protein